MNNQWQYATTLAGSIGSGLIAGSFFVFSTMVMPALATLGEQRGIAVMQAINRVAQRPPFLSVFLGTGVIAGVLAVDAFSRLEEPGASWTLIGSGAYLLGSIALTIGFHVPRNNALDALDPGSPGAADHWHRYLKSWTRGNHLRALASAVAGAAFAVAL